MELTGRVTSVYEETLGTTLVGAHSSGVSTLTVESVADLDDEGGYLFYWTNPPDKATRTSRAYSGYVENDDETYTITLGATTSTALDDDTFIGPWPQVTVYRARVVVDDDEQEYEVEVPHSLRDLLPTGVRDEDEEESCSIARDEAGDWYLANLEGVEPGTEPTTDALVAGANWIINYAEIRREGRLVELVAAFQRTGSSLAINANGQIPDATLATFNDATEGTELLPARERQAFAVTANGLITVVRILPTGIVELVSFDGTGTAKTLDVGNIVRTNVTWLL